jgi:hypothetical protein
MGAVPGLTPGGRNHSRLGVARDTEKCVCVLIVLAEAGGGVDAGDAGPRCGVVVVVVGGVVVCGRGGVAGVGFALRIRPARLGCGASGRRTNSVAWSHPG